MEVLRAVDARPSEEGPKYLAPLGFEDGLWDERVLLPDLALVLAETGDRRQKGAMSTDGLCLIETKLNKTITSWFMGVRLSKQYRTKIGKHMTLRIGQKLIDDGMSRSR